MGNKIQTVEESKTFSRDACQDRKHNNRCLPKYADGSWDCYDCGKKSKGYQCTCMKKNGSSYMNIPTTWICDICQQNNWGKQDQCQNCESVYLTIPVSIVRDINKSGVDYDSFFIYAIYSDNVTVKTLIEKTEQYINRCYSPKCYKVRLIYDNSFIEKQIEDDNYTQKFANLWSWIDNPISEPKKIKDVWTEICSKSITHWNEQEITNKGLEMMMSIRVEHKIINNIVSCEYLQDEKASSVLNCPVYKSMKLDYEYTAQNLLHLNEFVHLQDESNEKPKCKYGQKCHAFVRLADGENRLDDRCHVNIYSHPPRNERQRELESNMNEYVCNTRAAENQLYYRPTDEDKELYKFNKCDGYINALMKEVIDNGFKSDLCFLCHDKCSHNVYQNNCETLLSLVDEKLAHKKHKQFGSPLNRGEMLAMVLYTGCDCNYDLCKSQRNGDYVKWKWFDYCLYEAIETLSKRENACYKLYSGLSGVKLAKNKIVLGWFPTYTSTSWDRNVAVSFMDGEGMLIELDTEYRRNSDVLCCDISWISKFPDEREVLIARSSVFSTNTFSLSIFDENNDMQTVSLKNVTTEEEMTHGVNEGLKDGTLVVNEDGLLCIRVSKNPESI